MTDRTTDGDGNADTAVRARGLGRVFGKGEARVEALSGVDLDVRPGTFLAVMGPSGAGKSVLLHLLGGLDLPTTGRVFVGGTDLSTLTDDALTILRRRRIGFVFQAFNLIQALSARENVALPLVVDGVPARKAADRAAAALDRVGLSRRASHRPGELSGGEQHRVAIARALIADPVLILADEPTGNLDSAAGEEIMRLLRGLVDEEGRTLVLVTHDVRDAARAHRLVRLKDGRIASEHHLPPDCSATDLLAIVGEPA